MENEVLKTIRQRRSVRSYEKEQVAQPKLQAVVDAGCYAPCAGTPAHITVVQNAELIEKINAAAKQAARAMGMPHLEKLGSDPAFIGSYGAPTILIVSDREDSVAPELNCAAAAQNMLIASEALGLGACWVHFPLFFAYGPHADEIRSALRLPKGHKPCACIALGYKSANAQVEKREYGEVTFIK